MLSPAAAVIRLAGYPLELHSVTTADGYLLTMERIPRLGAKKVCVGKEGEGAGGRLGEEGGAAGG